MQPRAMTQLTERLMRSDIIARRNDIVVHSRSANMLASVAMTMSASGKMDRLPSMGETVKWDWVTSRPVITSSSALKANISRSRNQPSDAMRKSRRCALLIRFSGERSHGMRLFQCSRRICMAPKHQRCRWVSIPRKLGGTTPRPKQRGMYRPSQPFRVTRSEASVSSQMHHSFQPPAATSALRRNSPIVPTKGTVLRSLREDMTDR